MGQAYIEARNNQIRDALAEIGGSFTGDVVFAPSPTEMSGYLGINKGLLYHGSTYEQKLEAVTGLVVVHTGIVLARQEGLSAPSSTEEV